jgi:hypothetical protein
MPIVLVTAASLDRACGSAAMGDVADGNEAANDW